MCFLPPKHNFPLPGLIEKPNKMYPTNPTAKEIGFVQQRDLKLQSCKLFHLHMLKLTAAVFLQKPQPEKPEASGKPQLRGELLGAGTAAPADRARCALAEVLISKETTLGKLNADLKIIISSLARRICVNFLLLTICLILLIKSLIKITLAAEPV